MLIRVDFRARRRLDGRCACGRRYEPLEATDGTGWRAWCAACGALQPEHGTDERVAQLDPEARRPAAQAVRALEPLPRAQHDVDSGQHGDAAGAERTDARQRRRSARYAPGC